MINNLSSKGFLIKQIDAGKRSKEEDISTEKDVEPSYNRKTLEEIRKSQEAMKQYHDLEIPPYHS